jgi:uncharacterized protein (DUF2267 family)
MAKSTDLDTAVTDTQDWIDDLITRLGWHDRQRVYLALLAGLHALRDSVGRDEAVHIGAQLPTLLRGLYYEGWHPGGRAQVKGRGAFLERIHDGVHRDPAIDPETVARAVLAQLVARLPAGEVESARAATPSDLHNLWPA